MAFLGMKGTGDWATNQVPESWAEYILYENPNGSAPMFAMQSMFREETEDSHTYHWWTKTTPTLAGDVSGVYTDTALSSAVGSGSSSGDILYVKIALSLAKEMKPGHVILLRDKDQLTVDVRARVQNVYYDGAQSFVTVSLLEADDNHSDSTTYNLSTVDRLLIINSAYPEGSVPPEAIAYDPVEYSNYVQEFRDVLDLSHIALATTLRTGDAYQEAKRECNELHSMGIENSGIWGGKWSGTGDNGKPMKTSQGMVQFTQENKPSHVVDFKTDSDSDYAGKTWLQAGKKFLNNKLRLLSKYIYNSECVIFAGSGAMQGISDLAEAYGDIQLTPTTKSYGLEITEWRLPGLRANLKTHPLFSHEETNEYTMIAFHPRNVRFCPLVGGGYDFRTDFEENMQIPGQHSKVDGFYTVGGWKFYFPNQFMIFYNIGKDNTAA